MEEFIYFIYTDDIPGVLHRIASVFTRRKVNINSLNASPTAEAGISRFVVAVKADRDKLEKIAGQLKKIIEVKKVELHTSDEIIKQKAALLKKE